MAEATEEATEQQEAPAPASDDGGVAVSEAQLPEVQEGANGGAPGQIDILLDSTVSVSAGLGEAEIPVREALQLGVGSVVTLERKVGEPIDLFLRGVRFATGQLVVVGENLGVKINEIVSAEDDQEDQ